MHKHTLGNMNSLWITPRKLCLNQNYTPRPLAPLICRYLLCMAAVLVCFSVLLPQKAMYYALRRTGLCVSAEVSGESGGFLMHTPRNYHRVRPRCEFVCAGSVSGRESVNVCVLMCWPKADRCVVKGSTASQGVREES